MDFVIPKPAIPSVAIIGQDARFPVRRIYCVGRNYAEHAREMGNDPDREPPFFFSKAADCLVAAGENVPYPPQTDNLHFEGELVVAIGVGGADIAVEKALFHVFGYACGNDLTRRDMQAVAKSRRRPWDLAKGFDQSAICGPLLSVQEHGHFEAGQISTRVNGELCQNADLKDMIWPVQDVIAFLSQSVALAAGDLIFTGTPAGVGALERGDVCEVRIEGLPPCITTII